MKLSFILIGKKFEYQEKVFIKGNHNRGIYYENRLKKYKTFKKNTNIKEI